MGNYYCFVLMVGFGKKVIIHLDEVILFEWDVTVYLFFCLFVCFCLNCVVVTSRNNLPYAEGLKSMICLSFSVVPSVSDAETSVLLMLTTWEGGGGLLHEIMKKYLNVFQLFFTLLLNILPAQN